MLMQLDVFFLCICLVDCELVSVCRFSVVFFFSFKTLAEDECMLERGRRLRDMRASCVNEPFAKFVFVFFFCVLRVYGTICYVFCVRVDWLYRVRVSNACNATVGYTG